MTRQRINPLEIKGLHYKIINRVTYQFIFTDEREKVNRYLSNPQFKVYVRGEESEWREIS